MTAHGLERDDYEALVIGSGFGGAVAACRLAQAGIDGAIVERGRRYPAGSFPRDLTKLDAGWLWSRGQGLFDVRPWGDIICVQAAGYGGGSLVYANVAMRPPEEVFEAFWPHPYRRATLDPYFDLAAYMIGVRPVQPHPVTGALPLKTERLRTHRRGCPRDHHRVLRRRPRRCRHRRDADAPRQLVGHVARQTEDRSRASPIERSPWLRGEKALWSHRTPAAFTDSLAIRELFGAVGVIALFFRDFCGRLPGRPVMRVVLQKAWTCQGGKTACWA
jgi:choline dehydrogenase-like flavoprotein